MLTSLLLLLLLLLHRCFFLSSYRACCQVRDLHLLGISPDPFLHCMPCIDLAMPPDHNMVLNEAVEVPSWLSTSFGQDLGCSLSYVDRLPSSRNKKLKKVCCVRALMLRGFVVVVAAVAIVVVFVFSDVLLGLLSLLLLMYVCRLLSSWCDVVVVVVVVAVVTLLAVLLFAAVMYLVGCFCCRRGAMLSLFLWSSQSDVSPAFPAFAPVSPFPTTNRPRITTHIDGVFFVSNRAGVVLPGVWQERRRSGRTCGQQDQDERGRVDQGGKFRVVGTSYSGGELQDV